MRLTLFDGDVPVATLVGEPSEGMMGGFLSLHPGSSELEQVVHEAWRAISNNGFLPPPDQFVGGVNENGSQQGKAAIARLQQLESRLEWRYEDGSQVEPELSSIFGSGVVGDSLHAMVIFPGRFNR